MENHLIPYGYTRPLKQKVRTPEEAVQLLGQGDVHGYGEKDLVEGRFKDGERICIVDDMVTDFASKLIARYIIEHELDGRGIKNFFVEHVAVVLDREQGAEAEAAKYCMQMHSLIKFKTDGLVWLKDIMRPQEYALINYFVNDPKRFQDKTLQQRVLEEAAQMRR